MAITSAYIKYAGDEFLRREVGNFNKALAAAKKQNWSFELLEPRSVEDFKGMKPGEIAREVTRMRKTFTPENMKNTRYAKGSPVKIAKGVKLELQGLNKIGNRIAKEVYDKFPDILGGKLDNIEKDRYSPIDLGKGKTVNDIVKRAKTIQNRATPRFYQKGYESTYYHYISALEQSLPSNLSDEVKEALPDPEEFYFILQNPLASMYLGFDFLYDTDIPPTDKFTEIMKALS